MQSCACFAHDDGSEVTVCQSVNCTHTCCAGKLHAHGRHVVVKTHCWSDEWQCKEADHVFLTHRDLQGVVSSYRRVGWAFNIPDSYVEEHQQWQV